MNKSRTPDPPTLLGLTLHLAFFCFYLLILTKNSLPPNPFLSNHFYIQNSSLKKYMKNVFFETSTSKTFPLPGFLLIFFPPPFPPITEEKFPSLGLREFCKNGSYFIYLRWLSSDLRYVRNNSGIPLLQGELLFLPGHPLLLSLLLPPVVLLQTSHHEFLNLKHHKCLRVRMREKYAPAAMLMLRLMML